MISIAESGRRLLGAVLLALTGVTIASAQVGSVTTSQSTVNVGGPNTVNLLTGAVNIQGAFQGSVPVGTATNTVVRIGLQDALQRALTYNFGIVSVAETSRATAAQRLAALSKLLPTIDGSFEETAQQTSLTALGFRSSLFGGLSIPTVLGPYNYFDLRASVTQTVVDLSKLHNMHAATEAVHAAEFDARDARDLVTLAATGIYLQVLAADARVHTAEAAVRSSDATYQQAADRLSNGLNARIDVTRSEVQLQTDQQRLRGLRADFEKQKLTLARVIGLPAGQEFSLSDDFTFSPLTGLTQDDALARAKADRADIAAARAAVRAGEEVVKAARSEYLPTVSASANYGVIGMNPSQSHGTFGVTAGVNIPIWQGQRVKADIDSAESMLSQRRSAQAELEGRVDFEIRQTFIDLAAAADQVGLAEKNVELSKDTLRQAQDRFGAGIADTIEVVQAQQTVEQAENDLISAIYQHNLAKVTLARGLGEAEKTVPQYLKGK